MNRRTVTTLCLGAALAAALTGVVVRSVRALGVPTMPTMIYRGTLEGVSAGPHSLRVAVFTTATGGAETACNSGASATTITPVNGAFELPLDGACTAVVHANNNLWLQLTVDGMALPRTKLGAVPFAVEAESATTASTGSALDMRIASLEARVATLMTQNATLAAQVSDANPACPRGYTLATTESPGIVCTRTLTLGTASVTDQVVKVGGFGGFWVDRFEASIHQVNNGMQLGTANGSGEGQDNIASAGLQRSGARPRGAAPVVAMSHPGFPTVNVTWFQASEACIAAGKHLATRIEWLAAASGTPDDPSCNTTSSGAVAAAATRSCVSASGVHEMIGNVWEWTDEWYSGAGSALSVATTPAVAPQRMLEPTPTSPWPTGYSLDNDDRTMNVNSRVYNGAGDVSGVPSAAIRGGRWGSSTQGGVHALTLSEGPGAWATFIGFRCAVDR